MRLAAPAAIACRCCPRLRCAEARVGQTQRLQSQSEGCSGLVGEACARQLDGGVDGRRPPCTLDGDANVCREQRRCNAAGPSLSAASTIGLLTHVTGTLSTTQH